MFVHAIASGLVQQDPAAIVATALQPINLGRLIVFRLLVCAFGVPAGMAVSALLFGAAHLHNPGAKVMLAGAIAIKAGLLFSGLAIATGRIWISVGAHAG
ncbi:CPBP family intramembrane metalloprotease [Acetobacteraceae bacterium KSS8]|uniref:CPBP family intramembrane metalloprotease n=1 Tax=Endosaccharibacter trunci TaxID=2812733 RepID=A0ABT1WB95_9PROT|nr:CPBP family intramembrane metalloprotease [Acetobacteraceae bacterium KSS8]